MTEFNGAPSAGEVARRMDRFERDTHRQFDDQNKVIDSIDKKVDMVILGLERLSTETRLTTSMRDNTIAAGREWKIATLSMFFSIVAGIIAAVLYVTLS